jgi:hypothetical protein
MTAAACGGICIGSVMPAPRPASGCIPAELPTLVATAPPGGGRVPLPPPPHPPAIGAAGCTLLSSWRKGHPASWTKGQPPPSMGADATACDAAASAADELGAATAATALPTCSSRLPPDEDAGAAVGEVSCSGEHQFQQEREEEVVSSRHALTRDAGWRGPGEQHQGRPETCALQSAGRGCGACEKPSAYR